MHEKLTKSLYKLAKECPTKLYYAANPQYANQKKEDPFLEALAEGGFQVGELAKLYYPEGVQVTATGDEAVQETNELLKHENVTIFEAAIQHENLYIRADILFKRGDFIDLIEVKAKSIDMDATDEPFGNKDGTISAQWRPYLYDVAFQKYVLRNAHSQFNITAHLMLANKSALSPTDGLNQKFKLVKDAKGRRSVTVADTISEEDLSVKLLAKVNVDSYCDLIYEGKESKDEKMMAYPEEVKHFADSYQKNEKIISLPSTICKECEFYTTEEDGNLNSGFKECWKAEFGWSDADFEEPSVLDIWSCKRKDKLLGQGLIKMADVEEHDLGTKKDAKPGLTASERQWLQVKKVKENDNTPYLDRRGLLDEIKNFVFPLHFIDFETTMVAIPFYKGRHPYEGIAFQFSHHLVHQDGRVEHKGEYLNIDAGVFPNYDFVRALKKELSDDEGSIFKYSNHENTFLNHIYSQLIEDDSEIPDKEELIEFIKTITHSKSKSIEKWRGPRDMIDLLEMVKKYYYDPHTKGSNSIKQVLPAILNSSTKLQEKYSQPIYGAEGGLSSINFKDWVWLKTEKGKIVDPYKQLPKMFADHEEINDITLLSNDDSIANGGAALTAYCKLQFEEMSDYEREELRKALLKYCELDTLAMVMIYEGWLDMLSK